ncbi:MAG: hypothetical protein IKO00_03200 [Oscillospiraceae bacterium]|nr:hypothetical protein [Oscillospiraceae bacterium]
MEKMSAPKLEVIPFSTEDDIIVTSGIAGIPVENGLWYATKGYELREAGRSHYGSSNSKEVEDDVVYLLQFSNGNVSTVERSWGDNYNKDMTYAWHIDSGWLTGALPVEIWGTNAPDFSSFHETYTN